MLSSILAFASGLAAKVESDQAASSWDWSKEMMRLKVRPSSSNITERQ
jgi:hypothetical protein